jgi:hypothetical protein
MEFIKQFRTDNSLNYIRSHVCESCKAASKIVVHTVRDCQLFIEDYEKQEYYTTKLVSQEGSPVDIVTVVPSLEFVFRLPSDEMLGPGESDEINTFCDNVGKETCEYADTINTGDLVMEYDLRFDKDDDTFKIFYGIDYLVIAGLSIPYSANKLQIHEFLEGCRDGTYYQSEDEMQISDVTNDQITLDNSAYRNVIDYISKFYCASCNNNICMSVSEVESVCGRDRYYCLNIDVGNMYYMIVAFNPAYMYNRRSNEDNLRSLTKLKSMKSCNVTVKQMTSTSIETRFILNAERKTMRIETITLHIGAIEFGITISLIEHGNVIFSFIDRWIEHIRKVTY